MNVLDASLLSHGRPLWDSELRWVHVISDAVIALAYYSIPVALALFVIRRKDVPFSAAFVLFAAFIVACGTTHLLGVWTIWRPLYWLDGAVKAVTAGLSIGAAIMLWRLLPMALTLPSRKQLDVVNRALQGEMKEREQAEQALRESDERFQAFMAHSPAVAFIKDEAGRFLYFNDTAPLTRRLLRGMAWKGTTHEELWPGSGAEVREHDAEVLRENVVKVVREQAPIEGRWCSWLVYKFPFHDQTGRRFLGGMAIDETARRDAERALQAAHDELEARVNQRTAELLTVNESLRRSELRYRALVQASAQIVWVRDAEGHSVDPTRSWCRFTGQLPEQAAGAGGLDAIHPDEREGTKRLWLQAVQDRKEYVNEYRLRRADSVYRWMSVRGVPICDDNGMIREWVGMNTDITEAKEATFALRRALSDLKDKQDQLVQAAKLASLGELTAGVAHELNNPLNNISLYIGNVVESVTHDRQIVNESQIMQLQGALQEVQRAATIINHLRAFGRDAGSQRERLSVNAVVRSAVGFVQHQLNIQNIALHVGLDAEEPVVEANRVQLEQVLVNLLTNARDAVADRPMKDIHLRTAARVDRIEIEISDSGSGIAPDILSRIFDPFFTTKTVGQGTGLGLSISYGIVKEHGGVIRVESRLGQGATFVLQLPVAPSRSDALHERDGATTSTMAH